MTDHAKRSGGRRAIPWRIIGWSIPALLLLLPWVAMRFTDEVNWTPADFIFATLLFGSVGIAFEVIVRKSINLAYRVGAAFAVLAAFLTLWINGAVGMIGSEDNAYNLLFGGVLFVALLGAVLARFKAAGMARTMLVASVLQSVIASIGLATDLRGGIFSLAFAAPWLLSAALFRNAASAGSANR